MAGTFLRAGTVHSAAHEIQIPSEQRGIQSENYPYPYRICVSSGRGDTKRNSTRVHDILMSHT